VSLLLDDLDSLGFVVGHLLQRVHGFFESDLVLRVINNHVVNFSEDLVIFDLGEHSELDYHRFAKVPPPRFHSKHELVVVFIVLSHSVWFGIGFDGHGDQHSEVSHWLNLLHWQLDFLNNMREFIDVLILVEQAPE